MQGEPAKTFLIHGTFAGAPDEHGGAWWQTGGDFRRLFTASCHDNVQAFQWDVGENRETIRRVYGEKLRGLVVELEREKCLYAFVAHSHGGSVLWHGLSQAEGDVPGLPGLQDWVTVGTPFLHAAPEWALLFWLFPFGVSFWGLAFLAKHYSLSYWALRYDFLLSFEPRLHVPIWAVVLVLFTTVILSGVSITRAVLNGAREHSRRRRMRSAYAKIGNRHQILTASEDEAVAALSLTLAFDGIVLPASGLFTPVGRVLDRILWRRVSRAAQGMDIPGVRIERVSAAPIDGHCPNLITPECEESLAKIAMSGFGETSGQIRRSLRQAVFVEPVRQIGDLLNQVDVTDGLIHTSYFRDPRTMEVIATAHSDPMSQTACGQTDTPRRSARTDAWLHLWFAGLFALAVWIGFQGASLLLGSIDLAAMVLAETPETTIGDDAFSDPTEPYEIFRSLASTGNLDTALQRARDLRAADDRSIALAYSIAGEQEHGGERESRLWDEISNLAPQMSPGVLGPARSETYADFAIMRVLGRSGKLDVAMQRIKERVPSSDWRQMNGSLRNLGFGLAEGGHYQQLTELFSRTELDQSVRLAVWKKVVQAQVPCESFDAIIRTMGTEAKEDALASAMSSIARCKGVEEALDEAAKLQRAVPNLRAAMMLSVTLRDQKSSQAVDLLRAAIERFPRLPRLPGLEGRAENLTAAAGTYLDLNEQGEARKLMTSIEDLPKEVYKGDVFNDYSAADRAMVWARLGDTTRALAWWKKARTLPANSDEGDWYSLLQRVTQTTIASGGIHPTVDSVRVPGTSESADVLAKIRIELGALAARKTESPMEAGRLLRSLGTQATQIYDPSQRSAVLRDIGLAQLARGFPRSATAIARRCRPQEKLFLLAAILRWKPGMANAEFVPLVDQNE